MTANGRSVAFARSHPVLASAVVLVGFLVIIEVVGVAIYSFLLPLTG